MSRSSLFVLFFSISLLISCDEKREYDSYVSIPDSSWNKTNKVAFEFSVDDTISKKNVFINIRNNNDYEYSNLFLITNLKFPNGQEVVDTLQYNMADKTGKFLGTGFTEIKENKLFYKENKIFPTSGIYKIEVSQAMRKSGEIEGIENLNGITEVGFRIEKINKYD